MVCNGYEIFNSVAGLWQMTISCYSIRQMNARWFYLYADTGSLFYFYSPLVLVRTIWTQVECKSQFSRRFASRSRSVFRGLSWKRCFARGRWEYSPNIASKVMSSEFLCRLCMICFVAGFSQQQWTNHSAWFELHFKIRFSCTIVT